MQLHVTDYNLLKSFTQVENFGGNANFEREEKIEFIPKVKEN